MPDHKDTKFTVFKINGTEILGLDLDSVPIPDGDTDSKTVTTQGPGYVHDKALDLFDPGECEYSGNYIPGDPGQLALDSAFRNRTKCTFQCVMTESGTIFDYDGYVAKHNPGSDSNTAKFNGKIVATGLFTSSSTYAAVTKVEVTTGTVIPTTALTAYAGDANVVVTELTATTVDTIKITAATASYLGYSVDGGITFTALTSGTASENITLDSAGTVKKVLVKVEEADRATRFINVFYARA